MDIGSISTGPESKGMVLSDSLRSQSKQRDIFLDDVQLGSMSRIVEMANRRTAGKLERDLFQKFT
jgi:hypothetical protein